MARLKPLPLPSSVMEGAPGVGLTRAPRASAWNPAWGVTGLATADQAQLLNTSCQTAYGSV